MGCFASSLVHTARFYDSWPPRAKVHAEDGPSPKKRRRFLPYVADEDSVGWCTEEQRSLTHLHASSSATWDGQKSRSLSSGRLRCTSALLTRAGEDLGVRKENQDSALALREYRSVDEALFGVFDGHGPNGHHVSQYLRLRTPGVLSRHLAESGDAREAISQTFQELQTGLEKAAHCVELSGSTAVVALLQGRRLCVGWTGDSRAVLGRREASGKCRAVSLTHDHKPINPAEASRIRAAGGRIERLQTEDGESVGPHRVWLGDVWLPGLAMSRAMGDTMARRAGVISEPECCIVDLSSDDTTLILASDGVFEFMSDEEVVDLVCNGIAADADDACSQLINKAHHRWQIMEATDSSDDITAVVVHFKH
ncbi:g102 [Coccomyxa viridis]|uniref:protein-serine/threonine phosphatase n=1 Tax=Coccomyxa viridis TaxID=1274662 RepID=A0ABP1FEX3_9CHLO